MKITIICVGKIKEKFYVSAVDEYKKRLSRYCKLDIIELADEKTPEGAGTAAELAVKEKEGERILKSLRDGAYVIALAIEGNMSASEDLAKHLECLSVDGVSHLVFIIGGSLGLDSRILTKADELLSFSKMTFPHQLMRVIVLEQIYRCFRIIHGEPYHK